MEENKDRNEIYSQRVKAGKRTYFFDVRETRAGDRYLTITESKRKFKEGEEGFYYEKHKVFLYKEDFDKFETALIETLNHIKAGLPPVEEKKEEAPAPAAEAPTEETTETTTAETSTEETTEIPEETSTETPDEPEAATEESTADADDTELKWD